MDLNLKWANVDNYIIGATGILAAVAAGANDVSVAFIVLAIVMIHKADAISIY